MAGVADQTSAIRVRGEPNILLRLWRNKGTRSVILQILTMALLFAFLAYIINNAVLNLAVLGKTFSFDFLGFPASYDINQRLIEYTSQSTHFRAMLVGILNTALVAFFGIITATVVGFLFGIIRLSNNWIASHIVYCIIEFTRNVPVLLHILLIHGIIVHVLPSPRQAHTLADSIFLSNRGLTIPDPIVGEGFSFTVIAFFSSPSASSSTSTAGPGRSATREVRSIPCSGFPSAFCSACRFWYSCCPARRSVGRYLSSGVSISRAGSP